MSQKITITMVLDDDYAEPGHPMGVTEEGHDAIQDRLGDMGTDIEVAKAET